MPGKSDSRLCIHCSLAEMLFPLIVTLLVSSLHSDVIHANVTCLLWNSFYIHCLLAFSILPSSIISLSGTYYLTLLNIYLLIYLSVHLLHQDISSSSILDTTASAEPQQCSVHRRHMEVNISWKQQLNNLWSDHPAHALSNTSLCFLGKIEMCVQFVIYPLQIKRSIS